MPLVRSKKIPFRCAVCEVSFVSKDLLLEHKAIAHGLTQRRKRDGKLKMKTGKKPKKLETVDKKEVSENEKAYLILDIFSKIFAAFSGLHYSVICSNFIW